MLFLLYTSISAIGIKRFRTCCYWEVINVSYPAASQCLFIYQHALPCFIPCLRNWKINSTIKSAVGSESVMLTDGKGHFITWVEAEVTDMFAGVTVMSTHCFSSVLKCCGSSHFWHASFLEHLNTKAKCGLEQKTRDLRSNMWISIQYSNTIIKGFACIESWVLFI